MSVMSGNHIGNLLLEAFKDRPSDICQIDAATGEEETNESVLRRASHLAQCLRRFGLAPGDVLALGGRNHLDLHIPFYAALFNKLPILGVDPLFKIDEIKALFKLTVPKIAFCDPAHRDVYMQAVADLGLTLEVVAFGAGRNSMQEFMTKYGNDSHNDEFQASSTRIFEMYGQTENIGPVFNPSLSVANGSCGIPSKYTEIKLVAPETGTVITEPRVLGELWTRPARIAEYYNNPTETAKALTKDGWYKTGDLFYRDENNNYYFVERMNMLIKYKNYHVLPLELEGVIQSHEGVLEVCVTSIPHEEDGEHPVACVVRKPGYDVSAQDIKDLVADKLSENKQLRGGVVILEALPMTSTGKIARSKLRELALNSHRE